MAAKQRVWADCLVRYAGISRIFAFFCGLIFFYPVRNVRPAITSLAFATRLAGRGVGVCALHGHFCKIDRIGTSSRRLLHVIGTYSFI